MRKAWIIMFTVYLASISVAINQFKVPPVMKLILEDFSLTMTQGGWLMAIFAVASIILAIPAFLINDKYGPKITGSIALCCTMVGSLIGGFANGVEVFILSRILEGVGLALIAVISPTVVAIWFPVEKRGLPMGIWASWFPVGFFVSYNLAIPISNALGWRGLWWFGASITFVALVLFVTLVTNPKSVTITEQDQAYGEGSGFIEGLKTPGPWLLGIGFGAIGFNNSGFSTFAPQYYSEFHGIAPSLANFYTSIPSVMSIFSNAFAGWLIYKLQKPKLVHVGCVSIFAKLVFLIFIDLIATTTFC